MGRLPKLGAFLALGPLLLEEYVQVGLMMKRRKQIGAFLVLGAATMHAVIGSSSIAQTSTAAQAQAGPKSKQNEAAPDRPAKKPSVRPDSPRSQARPEQAKRGKPRHDKYKLMTARTLQAIEGDMLAKWAEVRSVSAKLRTRFTWDADSVAKQAGLGTRDLLKVNGRVLIRTKLFIDVFVKNQYSEDPPYFWTGQRVTKVSDGTYLYSWIVWHDGQSLTKTWARPPNLQAIGGSALMKHLRTIRRLRRLEDSVLNGDSVYVLQGLISDEEIVITVKIAKDSGILVFAKMRGEKAGTTQTFALSEIKTNVDFPEDHFLFIPPEGVVMQDLTQAPVPAAAQDSP